MNLSIVEKLLITRRRLNLKQYQLAKLLDVANSTIRNWEKGRTMPTGRLVPRVQEFIESHEESEN